MDNSLTLYFACIGYRDKTCALCMWHIARQHLNFCPTNLLGDPTRYLQHLQSFNFLAWHALNFALGYLETCFLIHPHTYQTNSRMGEAHKAVASANVLHSRAKNPIRGNAISPVLQNMKYPMPTHEWYFSDVNSVSKENVEGFSKPVTRQLKEI